MMPKNPKDITKEAFIRPLINKGDMYLANNLDLVDRINKWTMLASHGHPAAATSLIPIGSRVAKDGVKTVAPSLRESMAKYETAKKTLGKVDSATGKAQKVLGESFLAPYLEDIRGYTEPVMELFKFADESNASLNKEAFFFSKKEPEVEPFPVQTLGGVDVVYGNPHDIASSGLADVHDHAFLDAMESGHPDPEAYALDKVKNHQAVKDIEKKHNIKFTDIRTGPSGPGTYRFNSKSGKMDKRAQIQLSDQQKRLLAMGGGGLLAGSAALMARKGIRRDVTNRLSSFLSGKNARQAEMTGSNFPPEVIATADDIIKNLRAQGMDPSKVRIGVSGTPGTGKTTLSRAIAERVGASHRKIKGTGHSKHLKNQPVKPGEIIDQTHLFTATKPDDHFDVMIHLERPIESIRKSTLERKRGAAQLDIYDYDKLHKDIRNAFDYSDGPTSIVRDNFAAGGMRVRVKTAPTGGFKTDEVLRQDLISKGKDPSGMTRQKMLGELRLGFGSAGSHLSYIDPGLAMSTAGAVGLGAAGGNRLMQKEAEFRLRGVENISQGYQNLDPAKKRYLAGIAGAGVGTGGLLLSKPGFRAQAKNIMGGMKQSKKPLDPKIKQQVSENADRIIAEIKAAGLDPAKIRIGIGASGGTGKSTLAREIARKSGGKHIDLDFKSPPIKMNHEGYLRANPLNPGEIADQSHLFSQANPDHFDVIIHLERDPRVIRKDLIKREYGAFQADAYDYSKLTEDIRNSFDYNAGSTKVIRDDYSKGGSRVRIKIKGKDGFQSEAKLDEALASKGIDASGMDRTKKITRLRRVSGFFDKHRSAGNPMSYFKAEPFTQTATAGVVGGGAAMAVHDYRLNKEAAAPPKLSFLNRIRQSLANPSSTINRTFLNPINQAAADFTQGTGSTASQLYTSPEAWMAATVASGAKNAINHGVINKLEAAGKISKARADSLRKGSDTLHFSEGNLPMTTSHAGGYFQLPDFKGMYQGVAEALTPAAQTIGAKADMLMAKGQMLGTDLAMNAHQYMDPAMDFLRMMGKAAEAEKLGDHVTERAMERTNLSKKEVHELRQSIQKVEGLERGKTYHVDVPDRGYVVVGDVGKRRKKHVAKTILSPHMKPPGEKLELPSTEEILEKKANAIPKFASEQKMYRPRVDAIIHKEINGKPHVLVVKADHMPHGSSRYSFPGGGIDPGQNANQAAQMELREEAGVRGKNFKSYGKQTKLDLDSDWQARQFKKRGELWHGIDNQVVVGEYDKDDSSLHGSQGDSWEFQWEDARKVEKELRRDKSQFAQSNQIAADALKDLNARDHGKKAAYLSRLNKK